MPDGRYGYFLNKRYKPRKASRMRFAAFRSGDQEGLAIAGPNGKFHALRSGEKSYPGSLSLLVQHGPDALKSASLALANGPQIDLDEVDLLPPLSAPGKI